jgi:cytosine/adenosine deaminase-related metal-dependent hydrolase
MSTIDPVPDDLPDDLPLGPAVVATVDEDDLPVADPEFDLVVCDVDVLVAPGDLREGVDLVIASGVVQAIDPAPSPARELAAEVMDGRGLLAVPGLVNAHTHSPENPMRGLGDGLPLEPWLATLMAESGLFTEEDHYWCSLASAAETLLSGATSVIDHLVMTPISSASFDGAMRAYRDSGIRGGVSPLLSDDDATVLLAADLGIDVSGLRMMMPQQVPTMPTSEFLAITEDAIGRWHGAEDGRLHLLAGASGVQWASEELLGGMARLAERTGTTMQLHCVETRIQAASCHTRDGRSAVQTLDALGVLNERVSLAHCVWIEEDDIGLIAQRGATVAHNPAANQRLRSGRAPISALLEAGAHVGVGTDGSASGDDQNAWIAMRLATLIHRDPDEPWVSAVDALTMATTGGAHALGVPGLGALNPGAPADVALLDRRGTGLAGARELEAALVWSETGEGVRHVVVAGEVVVRDGRPTRFDLDEVRAQIAAQCARRARVGARSPELEQTVGRLDEVRRRLAERDGRPYFGP